MEDGDKVWVGGISYANLPYRIYTLCGATST